MPSPPASRTSGKNLLDSQIKVRLQGGSGELGKIFPGLKSATGLKRDGSTSQNALWVVLTNGQQAGSSSTSRASTGGNELDNLLGGPPAPQPTFPSVQSLPAQITSIAGGATQGQSGPVGLLGGLISTFGKLFSSRQSTSQSGVLGGETLGLPTLFGSMAARRRERAQRSNRRHTTGRAIDPAVTSTHP